MANIGQLDQRLQKIIEDFKRAYPDATITSGYRDPSYNASVGGARNSQHTHGNAFDYSVRGFDDAKQREMAEYLRAQGLQGFGYYPKSQSMHADLGGQRFWGQDYTKNSLGQTPEWFRQFAGYTGPATSPQSETQTQIASASATGTPQDTSSINPNDPNSTSLSSSDKSIAIAAGSSKIQSLLDDFFPYQSQPKQDDGISAPNLSTNTASPAIAMMLGELLNPRRLRGLI